MQPYLFPYIGYFQLINAVDKFVIYDDVQWIKGGWINRNRYLVADRPTYFTLPTQRGMFPSNINQRVFVPGIEYHKQRMLRQLRHSYVNAPHFEAVFLLVAKCFSCTDNNVSVFVTNALRECCAFLKISTPILISSEIDICDEYEAQDRVLAINRLLNSQQFINPIGGVSLYDKAQFAAGGVHLRFMRTREFSYRQFNRVFSGSLSIIDVMMFNNEMETTNLLSEFDLE